MMILLTSNFADLVVDEQTTCEWFWACGTQQTCILISMPGSIFFYFILSCIGGRLVREHVMSQRMHGLLIHMMKHIVRINHLNIARFVNLLCLPYYGAPRSSQWWSFWPQTSLTLWLTNNLRANDSEHVWPTILVFLYPCPVLSSSIIFYLVLGSGLCVSMWWVNACMACWSTWWNTSSGSTTWILLDLWICCVCLIMGP